MNRSNYIKNVLIVFTILFIQPCAVLATEQLPDTVVLEGKRVPFQRYYRKCGFPMEMYFEKHPDKLRKHLQGECSALWRGYKGNYEIIDGQLYCTEMLGVEDLFKAREQKEEKESWLTRWLAGGKDTLLQRVFPGKKSIPVTWFTSMEILGVDEVAERSGPWPGEQMYRKYVFLDFVDGKLKRQMSLSPEEYEKYKDALFSDLKNDAKRYETIFKAERQDNDNMVKNYGKENYYSDDQLQNRIQRRILLYTIKYPLDVGMKDHK